MAIGVGKMEELRLIDFFLTRCDEDFIFFFFFPYGKPVPSTIQLKILLSPTDL